MQTTPPLFLRLAGWVLMTLFCLSAIPEAYAQSSSGDQPKTVTGQRYAPGIWVDPDGCEHWVMDDGVEGYMTPHVTRDGRPVCRRGQTCAQVNSDQLFAVDSAAISASGRNQLGQFFQSSQSAAYTIIGHTDSSASVAYNDSLSVRRARAVAAVAESAGANVVSVRGLGERQPRASNATSAGRAQNRRVEILCSN